MSQVRARLILPALVATVVLYGALGCTQAEVPLKLILSSHLGWEVDETSKANVCSVASHDPCRVNAPASTEPGGFENPEAVAVAADGDVFIADRGNSRVQEVSSTGVFIAMFGMEVNETTLANVCTAEEIKTLHVKCKAGLSGPGKTTVAAHSIAVAPGTGDVYLEDFANDRVDEYTSSGTFVLMIGREVNETEDAVNGSTEAEKNLCTAASGNSCGGGRESEPESKEVGAFRFAQEAKDILAVSSDSEHLLYVGDEHRVQKFKPSGEAVGEVSLPSSITEVAPEGRIVALALEGTELYIDYNQEPTVRKLSETGEEKNNFTVPARESGRTEAIIAFALDSAGNIAIAPYEVNGSPGEQVGYLYKASEGRLISTFNVPVSGAEPGIDGVGLDSSGNLYAALASQQQILGYSSEPAPEVVTGAADCAAGPEIDTSATFDCTVQGEINPYDVAGSKISFEWGHSCAFGSSTPSEAVPTEEALLPVSAPLEVRPAESYCYRIVGTNELVQPPESVTGENESFTTASVPPKTIGTPSASFVTSSSAILFGELNPENSATEYLFEYAEDEGTLVKCPVKTNCASVVDTPPTESSLYGRIGATSTIGGLRPETTYYFRLAVNSKVGAGNAPPPLEGSFTTPPGAKVEADTGPATAVTSTSALAFGSVNPDGRPATYTFQLGVNKGAKTQYATVVSAATGASTGFEPEVVQFTGLEPGTEYAYEITIYSGYGTAVGQPGTFTTASLPSLVPAPAFAPLLPTPAIKFPAKPPAKCKSGYKRNKQGKCVKVKKPKRKAKKARGKKK